jgi:hypothetical protein
VECDRDELINHGEERPRPIGHHRSRYAVMIERKNKDPASGSQVAARGDTHIDDLAVLVDRAVDLAPPARDLQVGLIHVPPVTDRVATRPRPVDQQRGKRCTHRYTVT